MKTKLFGRLFGFYIRISSRSFIVVINYLISFVHIEIRIEVFFIHSYYLEIQLEVIMNKVKILNLL